MYGTLQILQQQRISNAGNKKGVFTRDRSPKMAAHFLKERWEGIS